MDGEGGIRGIGEGEGIGEIGDVEGLGEIGISVPRVSGVLGVVGGQGWIRLTFGRINYYFP